VRDVTSVWGQNLPFPLTIAAAINNCVHAPMPRDEKLFMQFLSSVYYLLNHLTKFHNKL